VHRFSAMLAVVLIAAQPGVADAVPVPLCTDYATRASLPATRWLDTPGTLVGTPGIDVLVGHLSRTWPLRTGN
jgi:hypothetical protein